MVELAVAKAQIAYLSGQLDKVTKHVEMAKKIIICADQALKHEEVADVDMD